jgi:hypothetical protein
MNSRKKGSKFMKSSDGKMINALKARENALTMSTR